MVSNAEFPPWLVRCPMCGRKLGLNAGNVARLVDAMYVRADGRPWSHDYGAAANRDGCDGERPCQPLPSTVVRCTACRGDFMLGMDVVASTNVHLPLPTAAGAATVKPKWHGPVRRILVLGWPDEVGERLMAALVKAAGDLPVGQCEVAEWPNSHWPGAVRRWADGRGYRYHYPKIGDGAGPINQTFVESWRPDVVLVVGSPPRSMPVSKSNRTVRAIRGLLHLASGVEVVPVATQLQLVKGLGRGRVELHQGDG